MLEVDPRRELRFVRYASGNFGKNLVWSTADLTLLFILTDLIELPTSLGRVADDDRFRRRFSL